MSDLLSSLAYGGIVPENYLKFQLGFSPVSDSWEEDTAAVLRAVPEELSRKIKEQFSVSKDELARVVGDRGTIWFLREQDGNAGFLHTRPKWANPLEWAKLLEENIEVSFLLLARDESKKATAERASQEVSKWRQTMNLFALGLDRATASPDAQEPFDVTKLFSPRAQPKPLVLSEQFAKVKADSPLSALIKEIAPFSNPTTVKRDDLLSFIERFQSLPQCQTLQNFILDHVLRPDFRDLTEAMTRFLILRSERVSEDLETYISDIEQHADRLPNPSNVKKILEETLHALEGEKIDVSEIDALLQKAQADWERAKIVLAYSPELQNMLEQFEFIKDSAQQHLQTICPVSQTPAAETEGPCPPAVA